VTKRGLCWGHCRDLSAGRLPEKYALPRLVWLPGRFEVSLACLGRLQVQSSAQRPLGVVVMEVLGEVEAIPRRAGAGKGIPSEKVILPWAGGRYVEPGVLAVLEGAARRGEAPRQVAMRVLEGWARER
jgi:hypothetical protein